MAEAHYLVIIFLVLAPFLLASFSTLLSICFILTPFISAALSEVCVTFPWLLFFSAVGGKVWIGGKKGETLKDTRSEKQPETLEAGISRGEEGTGSSGGGGMRLSQFPSQSVVKTVSQSEQSVPSQRLLLNSPFHGCRGRGGTHFAKHERTLYMAVPSDSFPSSHPLSKYWHRTRKASCISLSCIRHFVLLNYWYSCMVGGGGGWFCWTQPCPWVVFTHLLR